MLLDISKLVPTYHFQRRNNWERYGIILFSEEVPET